MAFYPLTLPLIDGTWNHCLCGDYRFESFGNIGNRRKLCYFKPAMTVLTGSASATVTKFLKTLGAAGMFAVPSLHAFILMCLGVGVLWQRNFRADYVYPNSL